MEIRSRHKMEVERIGSFAPRSHGACARVHWVPHDGILHAKQIETDGIRIRRIDRSTPIVAETEQIADDRNSGLESRAQISDGSASEGEYCR